MKTIQNENGFTLIEIAIVLVIIGLLLGGVLKGQELITSARVRNLISQQDGIKAAFFGFQDRFRAYPGDYAQATTNISGISTNGNGNGNGQIENAGSATDTAEDVLVWEHLSKSGFINGSYTYAANDSDISTPKNPYSVYINLQYDGDFGSAPGTFGATTVTAGKSVPKHNLKTGSQIPVAIISEVDRKVDDGFPNTGSFQVSTYHGDGATVPSPATDTNCTTGTDNTATWNIQAGSANCGGASLF